MQSFEIDKTDLLRIKAALEGDDAELQLVLKDYHASEIAILFENFRRKLRNVSSISCPTEILHLRLSQK
jgi:magnesium transporter